MRNEYSLYDDICFELTNYENSDDQETTDEEWKDAFYDLLCRVQNAIDLGELIWSEGLVSRTINSMTVMELIEKLQELPKHLPVMLMCTYDCGFGTAGGKITSIEAESNCIELWNEEC